MQIIRGGDLTKGLLFYGYVMKITGRVVNILSMVVTLCYFMSVIGYDLHICDHTGERYITSFITGISCEDLHPGHLRPQENGHNEDCCCGHHCTEGRHDGMNIDESPCCTDDYKVLTLTGSRGDDNRIVFLLCQCGFFSDSVFRSMSGTDSCRSSRLIHSGADSGSFLPADFMSVYGVWRI